MNNSIFREKSMSQINSPEKLNEYIRVSSPAIWMTIAAIILIMIGAFTWFFSTRLEVRTGDGHAEEIRPISYIIN